MDFVKHYWVNGEFFTASLMNRIEDAIEELADNTIEIASDSDCDELFENFLED